MVLYQLCRKSQVKKKKKEKLWDGKKGIHLLRRSIFKLIHFVITSLILTLMKIQLFPCISGRRVTYKAKRTANVCEAFHSVFGKYFYSAHPNIFVFYEVLKII
jgi:hypothetical protein